MMAEPRSGDPVPPAMAPSGSDPVERIMGECAVAACWSITGGRRSGEAPAAAAASPFTFIVVAVVVGLSGKSRGGSSGGRDGEGGVEPAGEVAGEVDW